MNHIFNLVTSSKISLKVFRIITLFWKTVLVCVLLYRLIRGFLIFEITDYGHPMNWHKSKISEKFGRCGRQNMLRPYLKIREWEWIFGRAVRAIFCLGVRSLCVSPLKFKDLLVIGTHCFKFPAQAKNWDRKEAYESVFKSDQHFYILVLESNVVDKFDLQNGQNWSLYKKLAADHMKVWCFVWSARFEF